MSSFDQDRSRSDLGRIAIVGAGQIGTMLGMALRDAGCTDVAVHDRNRSVAEASVELGAATTRLSEAREALDYDTVILALPVGEIIRTLEDLGPHVRPGSFVVDTGSAKAAVTRAMRESVPDGVHVIGGHPMTGNERSGPLAADPKLLRGASFLFTKVREDQVALDRACSLAELVGATVVEVDAEEHDEVLARTSHIAHIAAFALAALIDHGRSGAASVISSSGFRTTTRLADSNPEMVAGFLYANGANVKVALKELIENLGEAYGLLDQDPDGLRALLQTWQHVAGERVSSVPIGANA